MDPPPHEEADARRLQQPGNDNDNDAHSTTTTPHTHTRNENAEEKEEEEEDLFGDMGDLSDNEKDELKQDHEEYAVHNATTPIKDHADELRDGMDDEAEFDNVQDVSIVKHTRANRIEDDEDEDETSQYNGTRPEEEEQEQQQEQLDEEEQLEKHDYNDYGGSEIPRGSPPKRSRPEVVQPLTIANIPRLENRPFIAKLPNFLSIDANPFDSNEFEEQLGDVEDLSNTDYLKTQLRLENTIRWRYSAADGARKDSNARLIRWSDNTFSLLLGDEMFACPIKSLTTSHQYLVTLHESEAVMETTSRFTQMMLFAPSSARSTLRNSSHTTTSHGSSTGGGRSDTHMRLAAAIAGRQGETRVKTKLFAKTLDPELLRKEAEKAEREALKAQRKLEASRRKQEDFYLDRYEQPMSRTDSFYNDEDDQDDESDQDRERRLKQSKRTEQRKRQRPDMYDSDSDASDSDDSRDARVSDVEGAGNINNARSSSSGTGGGDERPSKRRVVVDSESDE